MTETAEAATAKINVSMAPLKRCVKFESSTVTEFRLAPLMEVKA